MEKLQFHFTMLEATDKSNILCIMSIMTPDNRTYVLPNELKPASLHKAIMGTNVFTKIKNALKKRNQYRKVWIPLSDTLRSIYLDEGENVQFEDQYLEELIEKHEDKENFTLRDAETLQKKDNLKKIAEKFVLEKFSNKTTNANQWMDEFEKECDRFEIDKNEKKIEILRSMLEKPSLDWYSSMMIKYSINSEWNVWKTNFIQTYGNKGWSQVKYAFNFKYQTGSLLEYATKKEKLLLEINKNIDDMTIMNLIVMGLPDEVINKIDRDPLKQTTQLFTEINKHEYLNKKKEFEKNRKQKSDYKEVGQRKACTICEKLGKGIRFHPESRCYFKNKSDQVINNSTIDAELIYENQKNE